MSEEGIIKFDINWTVTGSFDLKLCEHLMKARDLLRARGVIGVDEEGIGFGNISERLDTGDEFIITGSQTGHHQALQPQHIAKVTGFDVIHNRLTCQGPVKASSESMSHGIIYRHNPLVKSIVHIHHQKLWTQLHNKVPTTTEAAAYGTIEMARSIEQLVKNGSERANQIIVMAGHEPGLLFYGRSIDGNIEHLLDYLK